MGCLSRFTRSIVLDVPTGRDLKFSILVRKLRGANFISKLA